jgi:hypothetical protein
VTILFLSLANHQLTLEQITALYDFGQFQYSYGNYSGAVDYVHTTSAETSMAEYDLSKLMTDTYRSL